MTVQRSAPGAVKAGGGECPSHPGSRCLLPFIFPVGVHASLGYCPCTWREQGRDPGYIRASFSLNMASFLDCGHFTLPRPLCQEQASFRVLVEKDYTNSFTSGFPNLPRGNLHSHSLSLHPSPTWVQSILWSQLPGVPLSLSPGHTPQPRMGFCFVLFCFFSLPSGVTGNHHTSECIIHPPYSMVISINCALVLYFVSLEPINPLFSQQSLLFQMKILALTSIFPEMSFKSLFWRSSTLTPLLWLVTTTLPLTQGIPWLQWAAAGITRNEKYIQ